MIVLYFLFRKNTSVRNWNLSFFPTEEILAKSAPSKEVTFNAISLDTRKYKFNREEANAR